MFIIKSFRFSLLSSVLLAALPLAVFLPGCGGGGGGSQSPTPTPTVTSTPTLSPTPTAASLVDFELTLTQSADSNYGDAFSKAIAGERTTRRVDDQFLISAHSILKNIDISSSFTITLPRLFKTGDVISGKAVHTSKRNDLGTASWSGVSGRIVVESRTSRATTLRLDNVILQAQPVGDFPQARGTLTFNGTVSVKW